LGLQAVEPKPNGLPALNHLTFINPGQSYFYSRLCHTIQPAGYKALNTGLYILTDKVTGTALRLGAVTVQRGSHLKGALSLLPGIRGNLLSL
jgi:hypothetical protein